MRRWLSQSLRTVQPLATAPAVMSAVFAFVLAIGAAAPSIAQDEPGRIRAELERTDSILLTAGEVVRASGDPRAMEQLRFARARQDGAWSLFRQARFAMALTSTRAARDLAERAVRLARERGDLERVARRAVEDAESALERARMCAGDAPNEQQLRLLDLAQRQLAQAQESLQSMRWEIARGLARQVIDTARLLCGGGAARGPGGGDCPRVEEMLGNVTRLYERATQESPDANPGGPRAEDLLQRAREILDRALESYRLGRCEPAFLQVRQARDLIVRALRLQEGEPDAAAVARALDDTAEYVDTVAQKIGTDAGAARTLLDNAIRHLSRAREMHAAQRLLAALAEARVARNLAGRAAQVAGVGEF